MSFWKRKKQSPDRGLSAGDAGKVQKAKRTIKRSPPVPMEVKILALEALESGAGGGTPVFAIQKGCFRRTPCSGFSRRRATIFSSRTEHCLRMAIDDAFRHSP